MTTLTDVVPVAQPDRLDLVRDYAREAIRLEHTVADLEEQLAQAKRRLEQMYSDDLVTLCDMAGVDRLGLEPQGNLPGYDLTLAPYYSANIPVSWEPQRRKAAFDWLEANGHGGLIKVIMTVTFDQGSLALAQRMARFLTDKLGLAVELKVSAHFKSLSSWLRRQVEKGQTPPLETVGGVVGRRATLKPRKEKSHGTSQREQAY